MPSEPAQFAATIATPLGWFYLLCAAANALAAWRAWRHDGAWRRAVLWTAFTAALAALGALALAGRPAEMPAAVKSALDAVLGPATFFFGSLVLLAALYLGRRWLVAPPVAWSALNASFIFLGASLTDPQFAATVTKPDNVAVVGMVYLLAFFTWLGTAQAVENDRRAAAGRPPAEKEFNERVLVWPDLVYTELISMVLVTVLLLVWAMAIPAPLEGPADPTLTPNPAKAPWYFLGLQEMLVFSDAWNAGVVVPCLIVLGLMAIPYLDRNTQGSGCYSIRPRRFAYLVFQFGFLQLWILLILVGTFMRGPSWGFFGLYEVRDPQSVAAASNVTLSHWFWAGLLGSGVPQVPDGVGALARLGHVAWREIAGIVLLAAYFIGLPILLGRTLLKNLRREAGFWRYGLAVFLLLFMLTLPLKMILRWAFDLSYIVAMPEYFLNF